MAVNKTILSAGEIIRELLTDDPRISERVNSIFPVVKDTAKLPYVVYRRVRLQQRPTNTTRGADTAEIEVICYTASYIEGVELAEAVRDILDGKSAENDDLRMRSCYLSDSEEDWENDAYIQTLVFNVKI